MSLLLNFPTLFFLLIIYNVVNFAGDNVLNPVFLIPMISGHKVPFNLDDIFIFFGVLALYIETLKSVRTNTASFIEHMLSMFSFIIYLIEFLLVETVATSTFFLLMLMQLVDVLAGFTISTHILRQYGNFKLPYIDDERINR